MRITVKQLRKLVREVQEEVLREDNAEAMPKPVSDFHQTSLGTLVNNLARTFVGVVINQAKVQHFPEMSKYRRAELNDVARKAIEDYETQLRSSFQDELSKFVEDNFVKAIRDFQPPPGSKVAERQPLPSTGAERDQRQTMVPPPGEE